MTAKQRAYLRVHHLEPHTLAWEPGEIAVLPDGRFLFPDGQPWRPYVCEACGGRFLAANTDGEAEAECDELLGPLPPDEEYATVCDKCWHGMKHLGYIPNPN